MAADRVFFDTNILIYAVSRDPAESIRRGRAQALLENPAGSLSVQVIQEFLAQSTRISRILPLTMAEAWQFVGKWRRFAITENTVMLVEQALELHQQHHFSIWDCLIIAAAQAQGCSILYTEDMQHGRIIDGLRIVNPFRD